MINGYEEGPLVPGEPLLTRPGFWSNHLMAMGGAGTGAEPAVPEWFGDDGADTDALSEILFDPERWPVFRVPAADGTGVVVIYRNLVGDYGIDHLLTRPGRSCARRMTGGDGGFSATGLPWRELVRIADSPDPEAEGVQDSTARLLLLLPLLDELDVPRSASAGLSAALIAAGAPHETAPSTAESLLTHLMGRPRHDSAWASPLSGP
ncbi:hypothetical protein [Streptomyces sp. ID01-9D]|uniref:hypothetical protein n=1 Tax=Streptomyces sp. ID01-9D TaxID=3028659 RepID=UPI0029C57ADF|nr:hypothetical protein [Streptomyces sp. ID01-9D]MDX5575734.1 hypothetical protein [Streptomyces sp. ID01-9D]